LDAVPDAGLGPTLAQDVRALELVGILLESVATMPEDAADAVIELTELVHDRIRVRRAFASRAPLVVVGSPPQADESVHPAAPAASA